MKVKEKSTGAKPTDLKVRNRMLVLNAMRDGNACTTAEISKHTGISRPTVIKCIQHFTQKGIVISDGKGDSTELGGKKPELYSFISNKQLMIITLWPNLLRIGLCNMNLKMTAYFRLEAPMKETPEEAFDVIKEHALHMLAEHGYTLSDLYGVSLSTSGTVDYARGLLKYSASLPQWGVNIPVKDYLEKIFGKEVKLLIDNTGKMTGRSELKRDDIKSKRVLVFFSTWGLSACLIEKGHVLNGKNSLIGEVGHMVLDPNDTTRCGCGSYGCAEQLLSIQRIRRLIRQIYDLYQQSSLRELPIDEIGLPAVFSHSRQGDGLAKELVAYIARQFAFLIRNISLVFDPELVIFQGDYAHADEYFHEQLMLHLGMFHYYPREGAFQVEYNQTSLEELDLAGAQMYLQHCFFQNESLYQGN